MSVPQLVKSDLEVLTSLSELSTAQIEKICKCASEHIKNGLSLPIEPAQKEVQRIAEFLILATVDSRKANLIKILENENKLTSEVLQVLSNFVKSERTNVRSTLLSINFQKYRLVHLEWRLEGILASRCLLQQKKVVATLKLHLCTESMNSSFTVLNQREQQNPNQAELKNRKNVIIEMPLRSLQHIIKSLEGAIEESRSRRVRNLVNSLSRATNEIKL